MQPKPHALFNTSRLTIQQRWGKWQEYVTALFSVRRICRFRPDLVMIALIRARHTDRCFQLNHLMIRNLSFHRANTINIDTMASPIRKPTSWVCSLSGRPMIASMA
jgi:hypothetical protein